MLRRCQAGVGPTYVWRGALRACRSKRTGYGRASPTIRSSGFPNHFGNRIVFLTYFLPALHIADAFPGSPDYALPL